MNSSIKARVRRQRTLRGAIEWSYNLLSPQEQTVFRRLGVFVGSYTIQAASALAGGRAEVGNDSKAIAEIAKVLEVLEVLADKSLITRYALASIKRSGAGNIGKVVGDWDCWRR